MKIKPYRRNLVVKPTENATVSQFGIVLPENNNKQQTGTVININENPEGVKIGDRIIFKKYAPNEVEVDNETFYIIEIDDILAILPNK